MTTRTQSRCFIYDWREEDEAYEDEDGDDAGTRLILRGYGINDQNEDVVVIVDDFTPYMYVELPADVDWRKQSIILKTLRGRMDEMLERLHYTLPKKYALLYKKKLYDYSAHVFPFLFVSFASRADRQNASRCWVKNDVYRVFGKRIQVRCHEHEASPILQFLSFRDVPSNGWVEVSQGLRTNGTSASCVHEIHTSYRHIQRCTETIERVPPIRILSFDIEVYSSDPNRMPSATESKDVVFQISCIYHYRPIKEHHLLTLGTVVVPDDPHAIVHSFATEKELLMGFVQLIHEKNPHVMIGYNIFGFDIPYMMDRAIFHNLFYHWSMQGKRRGLPCKEKMVSWSSSAYQNQEFRFLDVEGRIVIDLLPIVRRDYKLRNYKLATVSSHFLGTSKDPVTPRDIFQFYERSQRKMDALGIRLLSCIGKYCLRDGILVMDLFYKLETWIGLLEMAKLCNTSILTLYTQGQQIKVFSQIYKICMYKHIVVESSLYHKNTSTTQYSGAYVFDPVPGIYDDVVPFDFSSLYPTTIIAYNIDYTTFVTDPSIPDEKCHVIEWDEADGQTYRFRFIKEPKGILPSLLEDLLSQRKKTKGQMKGLEKGSLLYTVLDKRQLAYKVSANSMYGAMGVTKGYLPFLPGAMCTTAKGRQSIQRAANFVQTKYGGKLIYGDTDSIYCHFPNVSNPKLWKFATDVEKEFLKLFPAPMKLVFEEKVYSRFLIFTKKRYLALTQNEDLSLDKDFTIRGILLARRDNCQWVRYIYEAVVRKLMSSTPPTWNEMQSFLVDEFNKLCAHFWDSSHVTITKAVGKDYKIKPCPGYDEQTHQFTDLKKWMKRMQELGIPPKSKQWMRMYREKVLPAHVQLAHRMRQRGCPVEAGQRIEYVMLKHENMKAKTFDKIEDPAYQTMYADVLPIDFLYVLHLASNPLDQLLEVAYKQNSFVSSQYDQRVHKEKLLVELNAIFSPPLVMDDTSSSSSSTAPPTPTPMPTPTKKRTSSSRKRGVDVSSSS